MRRLFITFLMASWLPLAACASSKTAQDDAGVPPDTDAGTPDAGVMIDPPTGHEARSTVPGGVKASSTNYKLIGTTGKSNATSSSPNYRVQSGVVGASQE